MSATIAALEDLIQRLEETAADLPTSDHRVREGVHLALSVVKDALDSEREWERINALSPEDLRAELRSYGYTDERMDKCIADCRAMVRGILDRLAAQAAAGGAAQ